MTKSFRTHKTAVPDKLPAKCCISNLLRSCQRSTETRLAGILLLPPSAFLFYLPKIFSTNTAQFSKTDMSTLR